MTSRSEFLVSSEQLSKIQSEIASCCECLRDSEIGPQLRDLPFFLPLPSNVEEPPHTYLFVAMERFGNWLRTEAEGRRFSEAYVNFAYAAERLHARLRDTVPAARGGGLLHHGPGEVLHARGRSGRADAREGSSGISRCRWPFAFHVRLDRISCNPCSDCLHRARFPQLLSIS